MHYALAVTTTAPHPVFDGAGCSIEGSRALGSIVLIHM